MSERILSKFSTGTGNSLCRGIKEIEVTCDRCSGEGYVKDFDTDKIVECPECWGKGKWVYWR